MKGIDELRKIKAKIVIKLKLFCRFYPSTARAIATRILEEELNGQTYDEEDGKEWSLRISDRVREAVSGSFRLLQVHIFNFINIQSINRKLKQDSI